MGNRFREKVTEEGLDREQKVAVDDSPLQETQHAASLPEPEVSENDVEERVDATESRIPGKSDKVAKGVAKVLGGDILADKWVLRQIPLMLLCLFFLLLLVANRYKVESLSREKMATQERIVELREQRIQMQKQYQKSVKISQIAEDLGESGVGITSGPPYEIEK